MKNSQRGLMLILLLGLVCYSSCNSGPEGKHLFILSGQSNMARLEPEASFTPAIEGEFGKENVIVVKDALGGQPIRRWYKDWESPTVEGPKGNADLYDTLMRKVNAAIENEKIATVAFIWMQGERDAAESLGEVYEKSLTGLYHQLSLDMDRKDVFFVIGRLSDFDRLSEKYPNWEMIRDIQVKVAAANPLFEWTNTDDLNDGLNKDGKEIKDDLHMSVEGYLILGKRFADKSIQLINKHKGNNAFG